jgi:hypothetical protein
MTTRKLLMAGTRVRFVTSPMTPGMALVGKEGTIVSVRRNDTDYEYSSYDVSVDGWEAPIYTFAHRVTEVTTTDPWDRFAYHVHREGVDHPVAGYNMVGDALDYIRRGNNTREYSIKVMR